MDYVCDLDGFSGPVDRISPYHYYQHIYWRLRGRWRNLLYDWTRREPCDAKAAVSPEQVVAGKTATLTLTLRLGETGLGPKGRIAVYFPIFFGEQGKANSIPCFQPPNGQTGYGARLRAIPPRPEVLLDTTVHSTGSVFTVAEITVVAGHLAAGESVTLLIGDPDCKPPVISQRAKSFPLRIAIDPTGRDDWRPVASLPTVRVVGARPVRFNVAAPATPGVGESFPLRVVAADGRNHNPGWHHRGEAAITAAAGSVDGPNTAVFTDADHGTVRVGGLSVGDKGVNRIQVTAPAAGLMGVSNPVCPEMARDGRGIYFGEIHSHTELSDGGGTEADNFRWARDAELLDFAALADHFEDGQSYNYTLEDKWQRTIDAVRRWYEPGRFVTLLGYEIGTLEAHRNVYFRDDTGRMIVEGPEGERVTMDNVFAKLDGTDYILIPHAPKFHGINWHRPHEPDRQRLVEICSFWGISEEGGPLSVRQALDLGYKFGFTGGTDNHLAEPGNPELGGITAVFADSLTREGIFDALRARRSYATTGPRLLAHFTVNGAFIGDETFCEPAAARKIAARVVSPDPIAMVEIVRDSQVVHEIAGNDRRELSCEWIDDSPLAAPERELTDERFSYYYLRIRTVYDDLAWISPVWVHAGG